MPSQISGYEYDVFISYRHKDNKTLASYGELGWVSEFVAALAIELDAVVKRSVSIYFDKHPRDGLLDTHDVDASLSPKIKSVIFIPILSRTYCDPESFAWRNEFQAFNRTVQSDSLGATVRLLNGNFANRVLPIQIHDLEADDLMLFEDELKAKLRSIQFVFQAPGISRPLRTHEEDPLKNINRMSYRDQINKTAHAIKDILMASALHNSESPASDKPRHSSPIVIDRDRVPNNKAITIESFPYEGNDPSLTYYGEAVSDEVIRLLSRVKDLKVSGLTPGGSRNALNTNGLTIKGRVKDANNGAAVSVDAIVDTGVVWSQRYIVEHRDLPQLPSRICQDAVSSMNLALRDGESKWMTRSITRDPEAYKAYMQGLHHAKNRSAQSLQQSIEFFEEAIQRDPKFGRAYARMAEVRIYQCYAAPIDFSSTVLRAKDDALTALTLDPMFVESFEVLSFAAMCSEFSWPDAEPLFKKVFAINPVGNAAEEKYQIIIAQLKDNFAKSEYEVSDTLPLFINAYPLLHAGRFEEALEAATDAVKKDPRSFMAQRALGLSYLGVENYERAIECLEKAATLSDRHQWLLFELMGAYTQAGKRDGAQDIMEEVMSRAHFVAAHTFQYFFQR